MPRVTHDDPDRVLACPECDKAGDIYRRTHNGNATVGDATADYACRSCRATFDEPVDRPAREWTPGTITTDPGLKGSAKVLADMTVEEFDQIVHGDGTA